MLKDGNLSSEHKSTEKNILDFIENEGELKKTGNKDTVYITDFILDEDKMNVFVQYGSNLKSSIKEYIGDILIGAYFVLVSLFTAYNLFKLIKQAIFIGNDGLITNYPFFFSVSIITIVMWFFSTSGKIIGLTGYKNKLLKTTVFVVISWFMTVTYDFIYNLVIPLLSKIKVTPLMTEEKIILLAYMLVVLPTLAITFIVVRVTIKTLFSSRNAEVIRKFKLKHYLKLQKKNSRYNYNLSFFRDDLTGKKVVIEEHDRFMHSETIGATGSGKTSSVLLNVINSDLNQKALNEDMQKKLVAKWIKRGWCYLTREFDDIDFSINNVKPNPGYEEKFKKEILEYHSAGMTIMAPDDSLTDTVYELAKAKGFKCNRIDAKRDMNGNVKEGSIGFNPFYISPLIPEWRKKKEIIKKATLFADIMQIMYEMSGKPDPYFSSINRIATTTTAIVLMLTYPLLNNGKQPTLLDLQYVINDYSRIREYYEMLVEIDKDNSFQAIRDTIAMEFLGPGREKFQDHSKGLKVQINNFLIEPEIKRILCNENTVDLEKVLNDGEITVVNIELGDLGPVNSPAFGLFFSIAFQNAVLSRPGDEQNRLPHFWTIDELPILVSPNLETSLVLFRKFKVAMFLSMQTLDQFNKNPFLKYLKGIILNSCAHHFVFGRTNPSDSDIISHLAGKVDEIVYQEGATTSSMLNQKPMAMYQQRYTTEQKERITAVQQRHLDFQEITYFLTERGRAIPPRYGKVYFLSEKERSPIKRLRIDWNKLIQEQTVICKSKPCEMDSGLNFKKQPRLDKDSTAGVEVSEETKIRENIDVPTEGNIDDETVGNTECTKCTGEATEKKLGEKIKKDEETVHTEDFIKNF